MTCWKPFTPDEDALMRKLVLDGFTPAATGRRLGRHRATIYRQLAKPPMVEGTPPRKFVHTAEYLFAIPDAVLADRDRRYAMQPRDLTALLMGDPVR